MILGALGYSYSVATVASSFGHTAYGRLAFQDRLHNMEFYLKVRMCTYFCAFTDVHTYICRLIISVYVCLYTSVRMSEYTYVSTYV